MSPLLLILAAATTATEPPPARVRSVAVSAGQVCPTPAPGEVVVCHPVDDLYRIPKPLRRSEIAARTQSWVNRAVTMEEVGRVAAGLPNTCSVCRYGWADRLHDADVAAMGSRAATDGARCSTLRSATRPYQSPIQTGLPDALTEPRLLIVEAASRPAGPYTFPRGRHS